MSTCLTCSLDEKESNNQSLVVWFSDSIPSELYDFFETTIRSMCDGTWVKFFWTTAGDRVRISLPRNVTTHLVCMLKDWFKKFQYHFSRTL